MGTALRDDLRHDPHAPDTARGAREKRETPMTTPHDAPQAPQAAPAPQYYGAPVEDPGKTLGIVGFVLAFVFSIAGIVVSAIAKKRSREAGYDNQLAKWGFKIGRAHV